MVAQRKMLGTLPATQVEMFHTQLEAARADVSAAHEELERCRAENLLREQAQQTHKSEASRILAQLSEVEQDRNRLKEQVRRMQVKAAHDASATLKTMLAEKDLELQRISHELSRAKADQALITQCLQQSQV